MWNVYAFFKNLPASQAYSKVTATADPILPQDQNGNFLPKSDEQIFAAIALGAGLTQAQISTPFLRTVINPELYPVSVGTTLPDPPVYCDYGQMPIMVKKVDPLSVNVSTYATGAADYFAAVFSTPQMMAAPQGPVYTIPATFTITNVKGVWTNGILTFPSNIPYGRYAVIGMRVEAAGSLAARLYFPGGADFRPGVICDSAYGNFQYMNTWRAGVRGLYGYFNSTAIPSMDLFGIAAGAQTGVCYLDVVYMGPTTG